MYEAMGFLGCDSVSTTFNTNTLVLVITELFELFCFGIVSSSGVVTLVVVGDSMGSTTEQSGGNCGGFWVQNSARGSGRHRRLTN